MRVIEEFDASVDPMALAGIINVFHNGRLNWTGAELIFDTHNPIFLYSNLSDVTKSSLSSATNGAWK
ncbi:hypothetical protein JZ785_20260 [Alicyclobacillus curvatus]|nr:hypothetical protein JZ785_20260 [Alicyclobacillus curvatus]